MINMVNFARTLCNLIQVKSDVLPTSGFKRDVVDLEIVDVETWINFYPSVLAKVIILIHATWPRAQQCYFPGENE